MGKLFEIQTEHVIPIKTLFEGLKEVLNDTNFEIIRSDEKNAEAEKREKDNDNYEIDDNNNEEDIKDKKTKKDKKKKKKTDDDEQDILDTIVNNQFTNKKNESNTKLANTDSDKDIGGIAIKATDSSKTLYINVKLNATAFNKFYCKRKSLDIGINLIEFYKLIKTFDKEEILSMYINEEERQNLYLKLVNEEKKTESLLNLKLLDLDKSNFSIPEASFHSKIIFNTANFHKICREMSQIAEYLEIKCTKNKIDFTCKGDNSGRTTTFLSDPNNGVRIVFDSNKDTPPIIQGIFELKYLIMFSKYSNLCNDIIIYMKNNFPLCIQYNVATLGIMTVCLTPINENDIFDNFSDDENNYSDIDVKYK